MSAAAPALSVVIPVRNRPEQVAQCVRGVLACEFPSERFEVIVVDNGSTDGTAQAAREAGARVIVDPIPNRCRARNRGASEARAPWVAFIDSDCVPRPDWLARLQAKIDALAAQAHESGKPVGAIAGRVLDAPPANPVEEYVALRGWFDQAKYLYPTEPFTEPFALTANLAVRRDIYLETGGLDPALPYPGEDADWCWRLARAGWAIDYEPAAAVTHFHRASVAGMCRQACHWGIGQADLFHKWRREWGVRVWIKPRLYSWALKGLLKAPWCLATGRTPLARRLAFYDFLSNASLAWGRLWGALRKRVPVI